MILLYDRTGSLEDINRARKHLSTKRQVDRKHSTDESSPCTPHQAGSQSSWLLLGISDELQALIFHALVNGAGKERSHAAGKPTGPHCQKQRWPAENF